MYEESNMEIYNTICEIESQGEFAVSAGNSDRSSVTIRRVGGGGR